MLISTLKSQKLADPLLDPFMCTCFLLLHTLNHKLSGLKPPGSAVQAQLNWVPCSGLAAAHKAATKPD